MKKILLLLLLFPLLSIGQQKIGNQLVDSFPINNWSIPQKGYGLVSLPPGYSSGKKYPLIVNLAGQGEIGTGIAGLNQLLKANPQNLNMRIAAGFTPTNAIIFSPEGATSPPNYSTLMYILPDFLRRYNVDTALIGLIGYSNGAYGAMTCLSDDPVFAKQFKAAVLISPAALETQANLNGKIVNRVTAMYNNVAANKTAIWFICGMLDGMIQNADAYTAGINVLTTGPKAAETRIPNVGHSAWLQGEDTAYRPVESGNRNYLEWMLQNYQAPVSPAKPVARISIDSAIINNPNSYVRVNADSSLNAAMWQWVQYTGPSAAIWTPVNGTAHKADMLVSGLFPGTYTFGLYVNNSAGQLDSTTVTVIVKPVQVPAPRFVTGVQVLTTPAFSLPLSGLKISYNDGNP